MNENPITERMEDRNKEYENRRKVYFSSKVVSLLHEGRGLPFIVLKRHFYIPTLPPDLDNILTELCTKISKVIMQFA
jgi:hypothetical protein